MTDIATIGFKAETDQLEKAENALEDLVPAAAKAEKATGRLTDAFNKAGHGVKNGLVASVGVAKTALIGLVTGIASAIGAGAITGALAETADRLDDISKAASKLKVNAGDLQGLAYAGDLAGLSFDQLSTIANKMNRVIGQAVAKGKETEGVFKLIGISAKELAALPIDERFATLSDRFNQMNLTAEQTALILGQLGDRSGSLAALFEGGSDAIRESSDQLDRFNGKITNEQGKNIEAMNDSFTTLQYAIQAASNQLVAFISTTGITDLVNGVAELVGWFNRTAGAAKVLGTVLWSVFNAFLFGLPEILLGASRVFKTFGTTIVSISKTAANYIINVFSGAFQATQVIWDALPSVFGAAAYGAAKLALDGVNKFVQGAISAFVGLAKSVSSIFGVEIGKGFNPADIVDLTTTDIYKNVKSNLAANTEDLKGALSGAQEAFNRQMNVDNFAVVGDVASRTTDQVKPLTQAVTDLGGALDNTGSKAGGAAEKLTELQRIGKELDTLGAPFEQAQSAFQKLTELQKNGIITGDLYTSTLERIKQAFIATGGTAQQWAKVITTQTDSMTTALKDFSTNALTQTGDALADLVVDGKADFKALADSIIKDAIRMAWQMMVVKPIIGSIFGFSDGGVFGTGGLTAFAKGGVINQPTLFKFAQGGTMQNGLMGEAGPEAIMPLKRGRDGSLGVQIHGNGGGKDKGGYSGPLVGQMVLQIESSGDADQDRRTADIYAQAMEDRINLLVDTRLSQHTQYGGAYNRRGAQG